MRRTYISPEYQHKRVYGTYNMVEESNFFGSKMLDIEDAISIDREDVIYYQNNNGEQLDFSIESSIKSYNYSPILDKKVNHKLELQESQPKYQLDKNTKWVLTIDIKSILTNYIFSIMKKYRTFEGIRNDMTLEGDVNVSLNKYIENNVINRYKLKSLDIYVSYKDLRSQNILKFVNNWNSKIVSNENKLTKTQKETSNDGSIIKIFFTQEKAAELYNFDYFFVPIFEKL